MEERKTKKYWCIIILLIIIILLLLFFAKFGKIQNKYLVPTGNIDVFNIDIDGNCGCSDKDKCDNKSDDESDTVNKKIDSNTYTIWNEQKYKDVFGEIYVDDKNGNYIYQQHLDIFNNAFYEYTNKIAPGVSNTYYFVAHNNSDINVKYYVEMYESTKYDINLKYRLKRNGKYIIGNENKWVSANDLKTSFSNLNMKNSDKYSLDWKWEYEDGIDEQDTYIGENMDDVYKLNIRFYFEQV